MMKTDDFEALIAPYEKMIYNIAFRYVANAEDAKDVAQDAIIKIYRSLPRAFAQGGFSVGNRPEKPPSGNPEAAPASGDFDVSGFKAWAARITINTAIDELRRRRKRRAQSLDVITPAAPGGEGPEERSERREQREALVSAIGKLNDTYREIIVLRDIQGFSYEELAEALQINSGTVKSRLSRARLALRGILLHG